MTEQNPNLQGGAAGQIALQRKSWLGRNWKWLLLGGFVGMIVFGVGVLALVMAGIRSSDVAKEAVARAQANPAVAQRLGNQIDEGWMMSGSINVGGGSGAADLAVPISGPKGKATVYVTASKVAGTWNYSRMTAAIAGSADKINLLVPSMEQPSAATAAPPVMPTPAETATAASVPVAAAAPPASMSAPVAAAAPLDTSATEGQGLGTADGEQAGTKVVVEEFKRGGKTLALKFTIYNNSNSSLNTGMRFQADGYKENGGRSFSGITLIDDASKKKYFVVADTDGNCVCSEHVDDIAPKTQAILWAKFPAPPDDIQKITVVIPHFTPIDDVPIR